jgi:ribosome modulation factor
MTDEPQSPIDRAKSEGREAKARGATEEACPYRFGSPEWHAWHGEFSGRVFGSPSP